MTDPDAHAVARAGLWLLAACFAGLAALLAWQHPLAPLALGMGLWVVAVVSVWRPGAWLFWLPALLPLLNFSPWTGWWLVDESDLLVLAVLAGGYARWAMDAGVPERRLQWAGWRGPGGLGWLCLLLAFTVALGLWRGWVDAGGALPWVQGVGAVLQDGLYAGYDSAWNTWRVAKSLVWALLIGFLGGLMPALRAARIPVTEALRAT